MGKLLKDVPFDKITVGLPVKYAGNNSNPRIKNGKVILTDDGPEGKVIMIRGDVAYVFDRHDNFSGWAVDTERL